MKKTFFLLPAMVLIFAVAAPAAAIPDQNPQVSTWEISCPSPIGTFTVVAKGVPGWSTDWQPQDTPVHFRAGTLTVWYENAMVDGPFVVTAPRGLEPKLVGPCSMHLLGGTRATFDIEGSGAYFVFPGSSD